MGDQEGDQEGDTSEPTGSSILGGFFVYRARPTESKKIGEIGSVAADLVGVDATAVESAAAGDVKGGAGDFAQKGEITGMVLIKESGDRQFFTYVPIDPTTYSVDKFMEYFKDTIANNAYDNNNEKVFDLEALGPLINQLMVQNIEEPAAVEE